MLVNNIYFCRKERPSTQCCEVRKCRICSKQRTEFLPGCLRLNVGEIASCKLRTAINPSRPPRRGGGPGGQNGVGMRIGMLHDDWFLVKHVWWCKGTNNSWNCQINTANILVYYGITLNNVEQHVSEDFNTCIIKNKWLILQCLSESEELKWRVKSEEFPTGAQRRILKTELKQFVWKRSSSNSSETELK